MLPQPRGLTPAELEVKESISGTRGQKLFSAELGVSGVEQHVNNLDDGLVSQVRMTICTLTELM